MPGMQYSKIDHPRYKYRLEVREWVQTDLLGRRVDSKWFQLRPDGKLTARMGYAWDGASGPGIDTRSFMRGFFVPRRVVSADARGSYPVVAAILRGPFAP